MENKTFGIASFAILIEAIITYFNQFLCKKISAGRCCLA